MSNKMPDWLSGSARSREVVPGWLIGMLAGLSVAVGGAIKDAPYEGFKPATFLRSPIVGALVGCYLGERLRITNAPALFLATIGGERIIVEGYKLLRVQMPGKFIFGEWGIPKQQLLLTGEAPKQLGA